MPGREGKRILRPRSGSRIFALLLIPVAALLAFFLWGFLRGAVEQLRRPAPAHTETSALGIQPHRGDIVLILDDVGFDHQPLETAMAIDPNVNFAVLPNGKRSAEFTVTLHDHG